MKPWVKILLGILTSVLTISFILVYEFFIRERIDSEEVVVVKAGETIFKNETITEDKIAIERRPKETLIDGVIKAKDVNKIIGYDASQDIVGNSMISRTMIDYDDLIPDESKGEAIRPIPNEWIYAQPGSLRRKDLVDFYLVYPDGSTNFNNENGPSHVSSTDEDVYTEEDPSDDEDMVYTYDSENEQDGEKNEKISEENLKMNTKPFLKDVRVVYVKDAGNQEVVSTSGDGKNTNERLNASSEPNNLEVILNEEDFIKLMEEVLGKNARIYITYQ